MNRPATVMSTSDSPSCLTTSRFGSDNRRVARQFRRRRPSARTASVRASSRRQQSKDERAQRADERRSEDVQSGVASNESDSGESGVSAATSSRIDPTAHESRRPAEQGQHEAFGQQLTSGCGCRRARAASQIPWRAAAREQHVRKVERRDERTTAAITSRATATLVSASSLVGDGPTDSAREVQRPATDAFSREARSPSAG
jgi:hypothetical protein